MAISPAKLHFFDAIAARALRFKTMKEYETAFPKPEDRLNIEISLHEHPEKFRNQWEKILP